jgi:hypothetical protein
VTVPWQMNCEHQESGWCLECVGRLASKLDEAKKWKSNHDLLEAIMAVGKEKIAQPSGDELSKTDAFINAWLRQRDEINHLKAERSDAIATAHRICEEHDLWNDWPDTLHLSDVIEKRIANLLGENRKPGDK